MFRFAILSWSVCIKWKDSVHRSLIGLFCFGCWIFLFTLPFYFSPLEPKNLLASFQIRITFATNWWKAGCLSCEMTEMNAFRSNELYIAKKMLELFRWCCQNQYGRSISQWQPCLFSPKWNNNPNILQQMSGHFYFGHIKFKQKQCWRILIHVTRIVQHECSHVWSLSAHVHNNSIGITMQHSIAWIYSMQCTFWINGKTILLTRSNRNGCCYFR